MSVNERVKNTDKSQNKVTTDIQGRKGHDLTYIHLYMYECKKGSTDSGYLAIPNCYVFPYSCCFFPS